MLFIALYYRQLSADIKIKSFKIKVSFVSPEWRKAWDNKTGINLMILIHYLWKIVCNCMMLSMLLQYG